MTQKTYTYEEVYKASLDYFRGDTLATEVWINKYALKDHNGNYHELTPDDMHRRMSKEFSRVERKLSKNEKQSKELSVYGFHRGELTEEKIYNLFKNFNYIIPQGSVMSVLGNPFTISSLSNCLGSETKVLTRQGFRKIKDLAGDSYEVMTMGGECVFAPFKSYGNQNIYEIILKRGKTNTKILHATKDHRWFKSLSENFNHKWEELTTEKLSIGDKLKLQFGKNTGSLIPSPFGVAHGISFGDGHNTKCKNYSNNIKLCSHKRVLGKYFINEKISSSEKLCSGGSDYYGGLPNYFKEFPNINENKAYLYGWLSGYFAADGSIDYYGVPYIHSVKKENIEFVQDVCGVLGIGSGDIKQKNCISNLTNKPHTMYNISLFAKNLNKDFFILKKHLERFKKQRKNVFRWQVVSVKNLNREEEVFCAEVPKTHSFVIEGDIITGNCSVLPEIHDSYGGILFTDQQIVQMSKRRTGIGLDISTLRPEGMTVNNSAGSSTGAISFMERFSNSLREVAQSGRRGAGMITIDINHPDVEKFITIKQDLKKVTGANISVKLSDEFMKAVKEDKEYTHKFPINSENPIITKKIKARELWNVIVKCAHKSAEPGLMFWDRHHWYSTSSIYPQYKSITSNPCSEISMNQDLCRLMVLNLYGFVKQPFTKEASFDFNKFYEYTYEAMRLMDDLVELELEHIDIIIDKIISDPEPDYVKQTELITWKQYYEMGQKTRRTGLGFTALADCLAALGLKFDSSEALTKTEEIMRIKCSAEFDSTIDMAYNRGKFDGFDPKIEDTSHFIQMIKKEFPSIYKRMMKYGRRNISLSTVAPCGSLSLLTQTSSGIEPVYKLSYIRRRKVNPNDPTVKIDFVDQSGDKWQEYEVKHSKVEEWMKVMGETDITKSPYYKCTAEEIDWMQRVDLQAVVQKYISHSISSTLNLPENTTPEKVGEIYMKSWESGLKGVTVYRSGSRTGVLVDKKENKEFIKDNHAPKRPKVLEAEVYRFKNYGEEWIAFIGILNNKPYEIFTGLESAFKIPNDVTNGSIIRIKENGISRYDFNYNDNVVKGLSNAFNKEYWNYSKMISSVLRHGMPLPYVIDLVSGLHLSNDRLDSWKNGVTRALKKFVKDGTIAKDSKCTECGDENGLIYEEGCIKCKTCGYSKCN